MYCSYKRRVRRGKFKKLCSCLLVIAILFSIFFYYRSRIVKTIVDYTHAEIASKVTAAVNTAVLLSLDGSIGYDNLIIVEKNSSGDVVMLASDAYKINTINKSISVSAQLLIQSACDEGVYVPFGTLTGITLLAGIGKEIKLNVLTAESVVCMFKSDFEGMGINQTRHSIYIEIISKVKIIMPAAERTAEICTEILLCEAVIVGKIPEVYLNGSIFS